jgi:stage V sporulation protein B
VSIDYILLSFFDMGVYALIVGHTVFPLIVSLFNWLRIQMETGYKQEVLRTFLMPTVCSAVMAVVSYFFYLGMYTITKSEIISLIVTIVLAACIYFLLMILTRTLSEKEIYDLPMGGRIVRLAKTIGILRE